MTTTEDVITVRNITAIHLNIVS